MRRIIKNFESYHKVVKALQWFSNVETPLINNQQIVVPDPENEGMYDMVDIMSGTHFSLKEGDYIVLLGDNHLKIMPSKYFEQNYKKLVWDKTHLR